MKKLIVACSVFLVAACGGPSNKDIENALTVELLSARFIGKLAPEKTGCPTDSYGLDLLEPNHRVECLSYFAEIKNVDIENCTSREDKVYLCTYSFEFVSEQYGAREFASLKAFEETPDGWRYRE